MTKRTWLIILFLASFFLPGRLPAATKIYTLGSSTNQLVFDAVSSLGTSGLITLYVAPSGTSASKFYSLVPSISSWTVTNAYKTPVSKAFYIVACQTQIGATAGWINSLGYSTSTYTNATALGGDNISIMGPIVGPAATASTNQITPVWAKVPANGYYVFIQLPATNIPNGFQCWGFEE